MNVYEIVIRGQKIGHISYIMQLIDFGLTL
jgi:hypothetical protein